ncbi:MAG: zf-HC2 domain-containing protein [Candidatus Aminicenantales bacterium]
MTCRDIERLILERDDRPLSQEERRAVEEHLRGCENCRLFESGFAGIRKELRGIEWEILPEPLSFRTKRMALDVMGGKTAKESAARRRMSVPAAILAALAILTILTVIWVTGTLIDLAPEPTLKDLPIAAWGALLLIAQNALILFFTPVILRAMRLSKNGNHGYQ